MPILQAKSVSTFLKKKGEVLMDSLSVSFTLGKASTPNTVNLSHNNREFLAKNIDVSQVKNNVIFKQEDVEDAYHKLFDDAVEEYNSKQKQKCRRITNYYDDVCKNKRTEAFYEAIVQFGDVDTASCYSVMGDECRKMLCEYMENFQKRNPNLYVFNAVLHMDETTPHLHIDFIPFYTKPRATGLQKGVSMKAALSEQGLTSSNKKENNLVAFEEQERSAMEKILNSHGIEREIKHAYHDHMTVDEYKDYKSTSNMEKLVNDAFNINHSEINTTAMQLELIKQENEIAQLKKEKESPYILFVYPESEKQLFVQRELDERGIEYRETDNGFEAKKIYLQDIRRIEKSYTPEKTTFREQLRDDIDRQIMQSQNFDELLEKLRQLHYEIKKGKYISVRPPLSERFIRLKSLGEFYSEAALKNRIVQRQGYEADIEKQLKESEKKQTETIVLRTTISYFSAFTLYDFSMNKVNKNKHFSWENDAVLDNLASINKRINEGATIDTFRNECTDLNSEIQEKEKAIEIAKKNLEMYSKMHTCARIIYGNREATDKNYNIAKQVMELHPEVTKDNYKLMPQAMKNENERIKNMEQELNSARALLKEKSATLSTVEKIMGETYIQSLMEKEFLKKASEFVPNGLISM